MSIIERVRGSFQRRRPPTSLYTDRRISYDADGLTLSEYPSGDVLARFGWSDVHRATAFKRDLVTTDLACIEFELQSQSVEINEEIPGWQGVVDSLDQYLPGAQPYSSWWPAIVEPPFQRARKTIYGRDAGHAA